MNEQINRYHTGQVLIITAVEAEKEAVLNGLRRRSDDSSGNSGADPAVRFTVAACGVGPAAAAAGTARALAAQSYSLVVSAGIGGGFAGQADIASLVVASEMIAADLGAQTPDGFLSLEELGFGSSRAAVDAALAARLTAALQSAGLPASSGPILTVSTVTGTAQAAAELAARIPGAAAEAMEGYGVATAARDCGVPIVEIRAISNAVGPRDRSAWRIGDALRALEAASSILKEVLTS